MTNTELRKKLVELLMEKGFGAEGASIAADHLIANGVTVQEEAKLYWKPVDECTSNLTCSCCDTHLGCREDAKFCSECGAKFVINEAKPQKEDDVEKTCMNCGTEIAKEYCEDYPEVCEHWTPKKPQTKADRIRAMSDEELADWLARTQIENVAEALKVAKIPWEQSHGLKDEVKKEVFEWLKQPAK